MPEKKAPPKRSNGSAKTEALKTKTSKTQTKVRSSLSNPTAKVGSPSLSDEEIAFKAYALWEYRGRPLGSPEEDWYRAKQELHIALGKTNSQE